MLNEKKTGNKFLYSKKRKRKTTKRLYNWKLCDRVDVKYETRENNFNCNVDYKYQFVLFRWMEKRY